MALKQLNNQNSKEGFPITALREIKILKRLEHQNIIKLHEVFFQIDLLRTGREYNTYLVFDYMEFDFLGLIQNRQKFNTSQLKCIMVQSLKGLEYLHQKKIIHRDIKSANILMNNEGEVKIADFGLSRTFNKNNKYTQTVVTLWYRAPEILLGNQNYNSQIDVWSVGCFFAELVLGDVLFKGDQAEKRQLEKICELKGSITMQNWLEGTQYKYYEELHPQQEFPNKFKHYFKEQMENKRLEFDEDIFDLIDRLLEYDPKKRLTAKQALQHRFLQQGVSKISDMPQIDFDIHGATGQQQQVQQKTSNFKSKANNFKFNQNKSFNSVQSFDNGNRNNQGHQFRYHNQYQQKRTVNDIEYDDFYMKKVKY